MYLWYACMHIRVYIGACVCVCKCVWKSMTDSRHPLSATFHCFLTQGISGSHRTQSLQVGQGYTASLSRRFQFHPPSTAVTVQLPHVPVSSWLLGIWTSVLRFAQRILFPLCHLPSAFKPAVNYRHINLPRPLSLLHGPPVLQKSELFWFPVSRQMSGKQNFPLNIKFNSFQRPWPYTKQTGASCKSNWNMAMAYEGSGNRAWVWVQALLPMRHSPAEPRLPPPATLPTTGSAAADTLLCTDIKLAENNVLA